MSPDGEDSKIFEVIIKLHVADMQSVLSHPQQATSPTQSTDINYLEIKTLASQSARTIFIHQRDHELLIDSVHDTTVSAAIPSRDGDMHVIGTLGGAVITPAPLLNAAL
jgi:cyanophycinase-like exopeptidase